MDSDSGAVIMARVVQALPDAMEGAWVHVRKCEAGARRCWTVRTESRDRRCIGQIYRVQRALLYGQLIGQLE